MKFLVSRRRALLTSALLASALSVGVAYAANTSGVSVPKTPSFSQADAVKKGAAIARHAENYDSGWVDFYSKAKMSLYDARGDKVTRQVIQAILEGRRGDKSMVRFMAPADIRGVSALTHEKVGGTDDNWLYLPASRRVRRISGANRTGSFQGTEFTYEDLSALSVERYKWKFLKSDKVHGAAVHVVEAKPNYRDTGYSKLIAFINKKNFRPEKIDYYDKAGRKLKTLENSKFQQFHGRFWRPMKQEMSNHQTKKRTVIETTSLRLNLSLYPGKNGAKRENLKSSLFTRRALEGG